ncbi:protein Hook homolog 1-like [Drosophila miranda]|uniref:protein Hook homolog 1-like n=1 Tax=Drosophila miranda TaxID=7229 RepID=UPI0007E7FCDE|nr:protein Hook homolog 1-like [Drosophila miranda]
MVDNQPLCCALRRWNWQHLADLSQISTTRAASWLYLYTLCKMCCIALLFLLGLFSHISLAKSLMEPDPGCTDVCLKSLKSVLDQQLMMQLQMKNIENNLRTQQNWVENLMNHEDKLENRQKLDAIESRLKKNEDISSTQLERLDSVEHKLLERQRMDVSGQKGLLEMIEKEKQHLSDQQEKNDSEIGTCSKRLGGIEKQIIEQQERAALGESSSTERLEKLEDKQRQLALGAQQMLERLGQIEKQIAVEHAKGQLERLEQELTRRGKNASYLDKYRDRLTVMEKEFLGQEATGSSNETSVTTKFANLEQQLSVQQTKHISEDAATRERIDKLEKDFTYKQQKIESEASKSAKVLNGVKNQLTDHQTMLENEEKKLSDSQIKLSKLQDQLTNQQKKVSTHETAIKESESKLKTLWKNRFVAVQKNGSEGSKLIDVVNGLKNQFAGHQTKLENDDKKLLDSQAKLSKLQDQLKNQQKKMSAHEAAIKESESKIKTLWKNRLVMFQKLGSKYYYFERTEKLNWTDARDRCQELGSHLASLQDQQEFDIVTKDLYDVFYYWVDVNDIETEGVYMSSTTGKKANFLKWRQTPDDWNGKEDCVELAYESKANAMGMNDIHCSEKHMYICEK